MMDGIADYAKIAELISHCHYYASCHANSRHLRHAISADISPQFHSPCTASFTPLPATFHYGRLFRQAEPPIL